MITTGITSTNTAPRPIQALSDYIKTVQEPETVFGKTTGKKTESDPNGRDLHSKGAKGDAGKNRVGLVLGGFARALWAVSEIGTYGANKYTDDGWITVPKGPERYDDAGLRHWLKNKMGEELDPDTQLTHLAHEAWNSLAILDLYIRQKEQDDARKQAEAVSVAGRAMQNF